MLTYRKYIENLPVGEHYPESGPTKAELLEALCHFQTCARKAELAAQRAHIEKQHIGKLFLMETSHLLTYRHWIRMLQLECFSLRLIFEKHHTSLFPFSWLPLNGRVPSGRCAPKAKGKGRQNTQRGNICRYAIAFFAGLGLSCAGLLLGLVLSSFVPASGSQLSAENIQKSVLQRPEQESYPGKVIASSLIAILRGQYQNLQELVLY